MKKYTFWRGVCLIASVLWLPFIWSNSIQTAEESSQVSAGILAWFVPLLERIGLPDEFWHTLIRKLAHMTEFAIAGVLWSVPLLPKSAAAPRVRWSRRGIALLICLATAVIDETIQRFVPGRSCELRDVCIDLFGAMLGVLAPAVIAAICRRVKLRRKV